MHRKREPGARKISLRSCAQGQRIDDWARVTIVGDFARGDRSEGTFGRSHRTHRIALTTALASAYSIVVVRVATFFVSFDPVSSGSWIRSIDQACGRDKHPARWLPNPISRQKVPCFERRHRKRHGRATGGPAPTTIAGRQKRVEPVTTPGYSKNTQTSARGISQRWRAEHTRPRPPRPEQLRAIRETWGQYESCGPRDLSRSDGWLRQA